MAKKMESWPPTLEQMLRVERIVGGPVPCDERGRPNYRLNKAAGVGSAGDYRECQRRGRETTGRRLVGRRG